MTSRLVWWLVLLTLLIPAAGYSDARAVERVNSDLVNSLANLLSRTAAPALNPAQQFPPLPPALNPAQQFPPLPSSLNPAQQFPPLPPAAGASLADFLAPSDVEMYHSLPTLPGKGWVYGYDDKVRYLNLGGDNSYFLLSFRKSFLVRFRVRVSFQVRDWVTVTVSVMIIDYG